MEEVVFLLHFLMFVKRDLNIILGTFFFVNNVGGNVYEINNEEN